MRTIEETRRISRSNDAPCQLPPGATAATRGTHRPAASSPDLIHRRTCFCEVVTSDLLCWIDDSEAAAILGLSEPTAKRYWSSSRAWLLAAIEQGH